MLQAIIASRTSRGTQRVKDIPPHILPFVLPRRAAFLEAVSPEYAVISYAQGNSYGLPDEEIFERLAPIGTEIFETAIHGSVVLTMYNGEVGVAS